ncbi:MAG TPA: hypothetical protein VF220_03515 [Nitrososphaeraceae archaeon]
MVASLLILGTVIGLAKIYWSSLIKESKVLLNQTAPFEMQVFQEREKQTFPSVDNASGVNNTVLGLDNTVQ